MANDKEKKEEAVAVAEAAPEEKTEEAQPSADAPQASGADGLGDDDLMDLFEDDEIVNEGLTILVAMLDDVDIYDLLDQVREIQDILDERHAH